MGSGIWRLEPNQVIATVGLKGLINPWGHVFDDWGQNFATDGAGGDGINYAFPGSAYPSAVGFSSVLRGMNPGQPKLCGLEIVSGSHFPKDWRGTLVTSDFRGNRIKRFQLTEDSSGYLSKELPDIFFVQPSRVSPRGHENGSRWVNVRRGLVQPDHQPRRSRLS